MVVLIVILGIVASAAVGAVVLLVLDRHRGAAGLDHAALDAALDALAARAGHVLAEERHATVQAAVDNVVKVASATLGDTAQAGARELDIRSQAFEQQVARIGDALGALGGQVADLQRERASQTGSIVAQLEAVSRTQSTLAEHTQQLRAALANPKQRGQWGERMAEDVLTASGLQEGVSYLKQTAIEGGTIPDFRFLLPRDLELRMDVKFPVDNYLRVLEAEDDTSRARHTKAFVADVRGHIRGLAARGYIDANDTVDCLLLFIPNEAVYAFLHESDPDVVDDALGQSVVLCSPSTLFAVLAVVRRSVEQFQLERRSDEILRCLGDVRDEWRNFGGALDKLGRQLDTAHKTFHDEVAGTRRRVFQRTLDGIGALPPGDAPDALAEVSVDLGAGDQLAARKAIGDVRPLPSDPRGPGDDDGMADAG